MNINLLSKLRKKANRIIYLKPRSKRCMKEAIQPKVYIEWVVKERNQIRISRSDYYSAIYFIKVYRRNWILHQVFKLRIKYGKIKL